MSPLLLLCVGNPNFLTSQDMASFLNPATFVLLVFALFKFFNVTPFVWCPNWIINLLFLFLFSTVGSRGLAGWLKVQTTRAVRIDSVISLQSDSCWKSGCPSYNLSTIITLHIEAAFAATFN